MPIKVFLVEISKTFYLYKCAVTCKSDCWGLKMLKGIMIFRHNLEVSAIVNCHKCENCQSKCFRFTYRKVASSILSRLVAKDFHKAYEGKS